MPPQRLGTYQQTDASDAGENKAPEVTITVDHPRGGRASQAPEVTTSDDPTSGKVSKAQSVITTIFDDPTRGKALKPQEITTTTADDSTTGQVSNAQEVTTTIADRSAPATAEVAKPESSAKDSRDDSGPDGLWGGGNKTTKDNMDTPDHFTDPKSKTSGALGRQQESSPGASENITAPQNSTKKASTPEAPTNGSPQKSAGASTPAASKETVAPLKPGGTNSNANDTKDTTRPDPSGDQKPPEKVTKDTTRPDSSSDQKPPEKAVEQDSQDDDGGWGGWFGGGNKSKPDAPKQSNNLQKNQPATSNDRNSDGATEKPATKADQSQAQSGSKDRPDAPKPDTKQPGNPDGVGESGKASNDPAQDTSKEKNSPGKDASDVTHKKTAVGGGWFGGGKNAHKEKPSNQSDDSRKAKPAAPEAPQIAPKDDLADFQSNPSSSSARSLA